jgi:hypothetical protein
MTTYVRTYTVDNEHFSRHPITRRTGEEDCWTSKVFWCTPSTAGNPAGTALCERGVLACTLVSESSARCACYTAAKLSISLSFSPYETAAHSSSTKKATLHSHVRHNASWANTIDSNIIFCPFIRHGFGNAHDGRLGGSVRRHAHTTDK